MRRPLMALLMLGIGWLLAHTVSVIMLVVYSMPIIALWLLIKIARMWMSVGGTKHDSS